MNKGTLLLVVAKLLHYWAFYHRAFFVRVWACASLLHCERDQLPDVLQRILTALKPNGVCYMSFKYGSQDREKDGRSFTDLNEQQAHELLQDFDNVLLLQQWITIDKRPDRTEEWLNILFKKQKA